MQRMETNYLWRNNLVIKQDYVSMREMIKIQLENMIDR